jgi:hypothetical protein
MNEFFDGTIGCDFASEFGAHEFGSGLNVDAQKVEPVGIPASADRGVIV